jgi:hypothetical protein
VDNLEHKPDDHQYEDDLQERFRVEFGAHTQIRAASKKTVLAGCTAPDPTHSRLPTATIPLC